MLLVTPGAAEVGGRRKGQIRIDRGCAIADEAGKGVNVTHLAAFDHEVSQVSQTGAHQAVMDSTRGQQCRHWGVSLVNATVRKHYDAGSGGHRLARAGDDPLDGPLQRLSWRSDIAVGWKLE